MDLEELKKEFIIDEAEYANLHLKDDLEALNQFAKVSTKGKVSIIGEHLDQKQKVGLVVISRYVASKLDSKISENVTTEEISEYAKISRGVVNARAKDLADEGVLERVTPGQYKANPSRIQNFLSKITGVKK